MLEACPSNIYISNNVSKFGNLSKEYSWNAKGAVISIRDIFNVSILDSTSNLFVGEINTLVCFNESGELEILNVSIDKDTFKIINTNQDILSYLRECSKSINYNISIKTLKKLKSRVSMYYNMILDLSKSKNVRQYELLVLELLGNLT